MFVPSSVTIEDFKTFFYRDFLYLPLWLVTETYNAGQVVYYDVTKLFYVCKNNGTTSTPNTILDWDLQVPQSNVYDYVLDKDITKALEQAVNTFNISLGLSDAAMQEAFLYLTAHYLYISLKLGGLGGSITNMYGVNSRSVGNVSESYNIPDWMLKPMYSRYTTSPYGVQYITMVQPYLVNVASVYGGTNA